MQIAELEKLKLECDREAKKWVTYLASLSNDNERVTELTRKLLETWLEGHLSNV